MDDEDYEQTEPTIMKRKRSSKCNTKSQSPLKKSKSGSPEQSTDSESDDIEDYSSEEEEEEDDDYMSYFERDTSEIRQTVVKHVLSSFTADQRAALRKKVEKGVEKAFDVCDELVEENMRGLLSSKPTTNMWKLGMGPSEIEKYSAMIKELRDIETVQKITIQRILGAPLDKNHKSKLLTLFDTLQTMDPYSMEYLSLTKELNAVIASSHNSNVNSTLLEQQRRDLNKIIGTELPLETRILTAEMDDERKAAIYEKYLLLQKTPDDSVTSASLEEWIEEALKTPFTKVQPNLLDSETPGECLIRLKQGFQEKLSDMDLVLEPLLSIFNNRMHNPDGNSLFIGLLGSPGVGKTATGKVIADVWGLPFQQISLGGIVDSSILDGQHPGWVGSAPGRFAKALQEMGVINGVLFLDELDKLGETPNGLQVQYSLLHSTDPIQKSKVNDHYLGSKLPLDLSKCLIIAALNKTDGIDPALLNRMHIINVPDYTREQKTNITLNHLFPDALENAGLKPTDVILPPETCSEIQQLVEENIGKEGGVRGIKACISMVIDKLSILLHTTVEEQRILQLTFNINIDQRPLQLTIDIVRELYKVKELNDTWRGLYV